MAHDGDVILDFRGRRRAVKRESILDPCDAFKSATHWRMRAEEMRTLAEEAHDSTVSAMMVRIAADYDRLAKHADDSAARDSIMLRTAADYDQLKATLDSGHMSDKKS
jgi:hypothetical protein